MNDSLFSLAKQIKPRDFEYYLDKTGWKKLSLKKQLNFSIFQMGTDGDYFQILVPCFPEFEDYSDLVCEGVLKLAEFEKTNVEDVANRLLCPRADIIRIRSDDNGVLGGTLPMDDALNLFERTKRIIADAAMDVMTRTPYRTSKYPKEVDSFISSCRFGQTSHGSYVISVICPFEEKADRFAEQLALFEDEQKKEENRTRSVVKKLLKSSAAVLEATKREQNLEVFIKKEDDDFISVNFIEDLSELGSDKEDSVVEIQVDWSRLDSDNESPVNKVFFRREDKEFMKRFVAEYKEKSDKEETVLLTGLVSRALAEPVLKNRNQGEVTISDLNGKKHQVVLQLSDYQLALDAHKNGSFVSVVGTTKEGKVLATEISVINQ